MKPKNPNKNEDFNLILKQTPQKTKNNSYSKNSFFLLFPNQGFHSKINSMSKKKTRYVFKGVGEKKESELNFSLRRKEYLKENNTCQFEDEKGCICGKTERITVHHKGGRTGNLIFKNLIILCEEHHVWIHKSENEDYARRRGYLLSEFISPYYPKRVYLNPEDVLDEELISFFLKEEREMLEN